VSVDNGSNLSQGHVTVGATAYGRRDRFLYIMQAAFNLLETKRFLNTI
jgi:hypothetical protein